MAGSTIAHEAVVTYGTPDDGGMLAFMIAGNNYQGELIGRGALGKDVRQEADDVAAYLLGNLTRMARALKPPRHVRKMLRAELKTGAIKFTLPDGVFAKLNERSLAEDAARTRLLEEAAVANFKSSRALERRLRGGSRGRPLPKAKAVPDPFPRGEDTKRDTSR